MNRAAGKFRLILNGRSSFCSATREAENKTLSRVGKRNNADTKRHVRPGSFKVDICAGFSAEQNVIAHLMQADATNYKTAVIARSSPPCWNNES